VTPDELVDQSWIVGAPIGRAPEFGPWPGLDQPHVIFAVRNWQTRLGLVAAGLGIALMPGLAKATIPRGVRWIPIRNDQGLQRTVLAATRSKPSAPALAMVRALADAIGP
jgi:DNA-binding transcriptional LysR family regulator